MEQKFQFDLGSVNAKEVSIQDIKINIEFKASDESTAKLCELAKEYLGVFKPMIQQLAMAMNA